MPENRNYYVIADDNTKAEAMTKQEILAALQAAIEGKTPKGITPATPQYIRDINKNKLWRLWAGEENDWINKYGADLQSPLPCDDLISIIRGHYYEEQEEERTAHIMSCLLEARMGQEEFPACFQYDKELIDYINGVISPLNVPIKNMKIKGERVAPIIQTRTGEMSRIASKCLEMVNEFADARTYIAPYANKIIEEDVLFEGNQEITAGNTTTINLSSRWDDYKKLRFVFEAFKDNQLLNGRLNFVDVILKRGTSASEGAYRTYIELFYYDAQNRILKCASPDQYYDNMSIAIDYGQPSKAYVIRELAPIYPNKIYLKKIIGQEAK